MTIKKDVLLVNDKPASGFGTIKKDYKDIMSLFAQSITLGSEQERQALYNQALELVSSKKSNGSGSASTAYFDPVTRELIAVYCYYHKQWELVSHIEYGKKSGTKTGLNTMCKEGTSAWTKQYRKSQKLKDELAQKLLRDEITKDEYAEQYEAINNPAIEPHGDEDHSFATLDDLLAYLANQAEPVEQEKPAKKTRKPKQAKVELTEEDLPY